MKHITSTRYLRVINFSVALLLQPSHKYSVNAPHRASDAAHNELLWYAAHGGYLLCIFISRTWNLSEASSDASLTFSAGPCSVGEALQWSEARRCSKPLKVATYFTRSISLTFIIITIMADLGALGKDIAALGETIRVLKSASPPDKAAIGAAVADLVSKKKEYASQNNGIGVDGKPLDAPTKKEKGPAKLAQTADSINAQKKAAKKAEAKAKKDALKAGGGAAASNADAVAVTPAATPAVLPAKVPAKAVPVSLASKRPAVALPLQGIGGLGPLQISINPNVALTERPVVALSVACLLDTAADLKIVSDHKRPTTALGMEQGGTVSGDFAMARYLSRRSKTQNLYPQADSSTAALIDMWVDYAQSLMRLDQKQRLKALSMSVEHALGSSQTYLVGQTLTMADLCVFAAAGFPTQHADLLEINKALPEQVVAAKRWMKMIAANPALQEATQLCVGIVSNEEAVFDAVSPLEPLVSGMSTLEGAVAGRVMTRFPPEPSGYLHIGHSKAVLLNDYYARRYKGCLLLRFDDTNPSKEKAEFEESIVVDLARLGIKPDLVSYTSDYFEAIAGYARTLIANGLAYMDDTPQEQMKIERGERVESKHRNQSPDEAAKLFDLMCSGSKDGSTWCLRAKIDMGSDNGTMRDPVLFRQNVTPHHRSGTKFHAYPTYDLACPIVDSVEGVSHALRTTEYNDRDEQYQWIQRALGLRRVRIHAFSRVNFINTVLSKRKLTWFVEQGLVTGWDDPRFPTVRGVIRRGLDVAALRAFMLSQGASRRVVNMDWTVFWSENKKEIDKVAKRFMAIDKMSHAKLTISNGPAEGDNVYMETSVHPKEPSLGSRVMRLSKDVVLETADVEGIEVGETFVLMRWGVFQITKVDGGLEADFVPDGDFKAAKRKLTWVAAGVDTTPVTMYEFDNLVSKDRLDEDDNFEDHVNPNTLAMTDLIGDASLRTLREHDIIQLERRGYYRVDRPYINKDKPLLLFTIPDGKMKAMSGLAGKLAHR
jgi:glutamyl-tRNA synthetase